MTTQPTPEHDIHELDYRAADGVEVALLWVIGTKDLFVVVHDEQSGDILELPVEQGENGYEVFNAALELARRLRLGRAIRRYHRFEGGATTTDWRHDNKLVPPNCRSRRHRRHAHGRAGRHRRHDRLALLAALRRAERLRLDPRRREGRPLPPSARRGRHVDQAALLPRHQRPDHPLPLARGRLRGAGLHAGARGRIGRAPAPDPPRRRRARRHADPARVRAAVRLRT